MSVFIWWVSKQFVFLEKIKIQTSKDSHDSGIVMKNCQLM